MRVDFLSSQPTEAARVAASATGGSSETDSLKCPAEQTAAKKGGVKGFVASSTRLFMTDEIFSSTVAHRRVGATSDIA